jgi:hypothetical protein
MKTLCITGISEPDLIQIYTRFCQAGMAESLSIEKNGRKLNMAQWHDRFCSAASLEQDAPVPGKFGDQLASELFFSNMETPFWGWADSRSTFLLDYWAEFDPRLFFVLTCCPLDHHLARLMETQDAASLNLEDIVSSWHQFHAHLLQFYHTHPDRCLLVDIHDCATQFNALNQACRDKWHLSLNDMPETGSDEYPFPAPLARHIAAGFSKNHPEAASLWNEIEATVSRLTSDPARPDDISFNDIAQNYQTTKDRSAELRQISDLEKQIAALKKEQAQKEARFKDLEQKNQEVTEENDLILQQLHQVQEELESMFLKKQEAEQQWSEKHKKLQTDLEDKKLQIQSLKEEQNKQLEKAEARWERLLKRMPDYCDYGNIRITPGDDASTLICEVQDLEIGSQTYPDLEFETFLVGGVAGLRFKHPEHITQEDLIPVAQTSEEAKKQSKRLKSLSTTEWLLLQSTAQFLKTCLKTEKFDEQTLPAPLIQDTINGLDRLTEVLLKFPETLRYDEISFDEKALSEDCEHLEICLENLSCGDLASPEFVFRLSCAGLSSSDFGSNPRLDFPEDTGTILKTWFDCSNNPDDPRLELRFALPEAMDLEVWNQLSKDDAGFIHMLTAHLPGLIEKKASQSGLDDAKWLAVAKDVAQILKRRTSEE